MKPRYSKLLLQITLFVAISFCSLRSYATINPGTIQGAGGTWPYYCPYSYVSIYNTQLPTGGSGRYIYKWQKRIDTFNPWQPFPVNAILDSTSLQYTKPKSDYWDGIYMRRIVYDYYNPNDSAISNEVAIISFQAYPGQLVFMYGYPNYQEFFLNIPVGTTPPVIQSPPSYQPHIDYNNGSLYMDWYYRYDTSAYWQTLNMPSASSSYYQPPTKNTPVKIWYKREVYDDCFTTYPDGMSDSIYLNFYIPIVFDPGTISSDTNNVCPSDTVRLVSTPTTAPLPRTYRWESSPDSVNWYSIGFADSLKLTNFQSDGFYRRSVTSNSVTINSNVIKIKLTPSCNPTVFDPGTIYTDSLMVCAGASVKLKSTATTAISPFTVAWQQSTDSLYWSYLAATDSVIVNNFSVNRYYRKVVTKGSTSRYSNILKITVITPGNPSVFGNKQWNIYAYNGKSITTTGITYTGFYSRNNQNINTLHDWADSLSPSAAIGYLGCPVNNDNFTIAARRIGFDSGIYQLQIPLNNDVVQIKLNGNSVYVAACCNINTANLNIGKLDALSKMEIVQTTGSAQSALQVNFIKIDTANTSTYTDSLCNTFNVRNPAYNQFVPLIDSTGQIVASVNPNYVSMGNVSVSMKHSAPGAANMPIGNFGVLNMPRYFNFSASNYINTPFPNPVTVRLYYLNSEFDDYKIATNQPSLTINDLRVAHYDGVNQDCSVNNNGSAGDTLVPIGSGPFGANAFYIDVLATRFSEFGVNGSLSTLPVKWLSANASARKNEVLLQWKVANEINNAGFYVQRSADDLLYKTVGFVAGKTTGETTQVYSFIDKPETAAGNLFYQIKQVDKDNRYSLSKVMKVNLDNSGHLVVQPNPVNDFAIFKSGAIIKMLCLTDVSGRLLYCKHPLANQATINVSRLSKGIYMVKALLTTGEEQVIKLVKQ